MGTCDAEDGTPEYQGDGESSIQSQLPNLQWVYTKILYEDSHKGCGISCRRHR